MDMHSLMSPETLKMAALVLIGLVVLKMLTSGLLKFLCLAAGFILGLYVALKYTEVIEWLKTLFCIQIILPVLYHAGQKSLSGQLIT